MIGVFPSGRRHYTSPVVSYKVRTLGDLEPFEDPYRLTLGLSIVNGLNLS